MIEIEPPPAKRAGFRFVSRSERQTPVALQNESIYQLWGSWFPPLNGCVGSLQVARVLAREGSYAGEGVAMVDRNS